MRGSGLITTAVVLGLLFIAPPATAALSYFDLITQSEVVTGPPYPTVCHRADVAHEASGVFERDGQLALGVRRAADGTGLPLGTDLRALEDHVPGCDFTEDTHFDITYCAGPDGPALPTEGVVHLLIELTTSGGSPGRLIALHPELPIADHERFFDTFLDDSSVEIVCRVELSRGVVHELTLRADTPEGLHLTDAVVVILEQSLEEGDRTNPTEVVDYFTANPDGFFDVRLCLESDAGVEDLSPLLSLSFRGLFLGGTSPVESTTWGAIKALYNN